MCDRILDGALTGPLWLKDERIAKAVLVTMQEAQHAKLFRLHAYVLMANHVHVLIEPCASLPEIYAPH